MQRDNYTCQYCGAPAVEPDHVVPRSLGGSDDPSNLVAACFDCNRSGNAAMKRAWLAQRQGRVFDGGPVGATCGQLSPSAPEKRSRDW
jgi:hypothetical protein